MENVLITPGARSSVPGGFGITDTVNTNIDAIKETMMSANITDNEVVGTCRIELDVELRMDSPELAALLDKVTADGLPYASGYSMIQGANLEELIAATQRDRKREALNAVEGLGDAELVSACVEGSKQVQENAREVLVERIRSGGHAAFSSLLAAYTSEIDRGKKRCFRRLLDKLMAPVEAKVNRKGLKELQRLASGSAPDPIVLHAANERLVHLARRAADLQGIPGLPIAALISSLAAGKYDYDTKVKAMAYKRMRAETMGSDAIADLLPMLAGRVEGFLNTRGIRDLGYVGDLQAIYARERWDTTEVHKAIDYSTARLYFRATNEFYGRLPDHLHNMMVLTEADEYTRQYFNFLAKKDEANATATS